MQDGAFVYVPRGIRVELPFAVECGLYGDGEAVASFGRNLFIFEEGSQAQLVIDYRTLSGERNLACRTREIFVGSGARVEMVESCRLNERSSLISASYARQQGDSVLHGVSVGLSAGAHVYAKPQLEIYADNVKCSHGATVGQLDPEAIYYMRQRGIGLEDARRLQMYGFVLDVLGESRVQEMNELFDREIASKIEGL